MAPEYGAPNDQDKYAERVACGKNNQTFLNTKVKEALYNPN